jgi:hypothetical protein
LKTDVPDIEALMNAYHLTVVAKTACPAFANVDEVGDYMQTVQLGVSLVQGCDYDLSLELGQKSPTPGLKQLAAVYYKNNVVKAVAAAEIANKASYPAQINLVLQDAGRQLGLGKTPVGNTGGSTLPVQTLQPGQPTVPVVNLGQADLNLTSSTGARKLSSLFKGQYMVIDFSASWCGACTGTAEDMNADTAMHAAFSAGKCTYATVVARDDLSLWQKKVGSSSWVSGVSYAGDSGSLMDMVAKFGINASSVPYIVMVDNTGKVVAQGNGVPQGKINELCK